MPMIGTKEERDQWAKAGYALINAAFRAHAAGQPVEGVPGNEAIRAACSLLRESGATCDCAFDPAVVRVPCLTAIGYAAAQEPAP
ncbi:MAG TPA: hypothetical protein VGN96_03245 [Roseococcus sp.]|nr:hypothetical protein [Roseococcus sp.]